MDERRAVPRLRSLKAARIIVPGGHSTFDCMVRNLSSRGARVVMESTIDVPELFSLRFEDGSSQSCIVRWRKPKEIGVKFEL